MIYVIVALIVVVLLILASCLKIVPQAQAYVIERLGAYQGTWSVGFHIKVPFLDKIARKVNLKEQVADFPPQPVITKDNVTMREAIHYTRQIAVDGREYGHAHREVRRPKQRVTLLRTHTAHVVAMVFHPSRRAAHHLHAARESLQIVAVSHMGRGELDGHIGRGKLRTVEVLLVVYIYDAHYFMAAAAGYLLNHPAHLAVAY